MFQRDCCFLTGLTCLFISIFPLQKGLPQGFALRQTFFAFCIILFYIENRLQSHVPLFSDSSQHRRQLAALHFIPTDIVQYYGYMLRATQKLMYVYGFPEIDTSVEGEKFDSETLNILIVCLGVMYGVAGANNAIKAMAKALACGVEKKLINTALTKGTIYPIVKSVSKWFGVRMTKAVFAGFFKKAIPVVGGVIGGGITYVSFKPCCDKLKSALQDTLLSNPDHQEAAEENIIIESENSNIIENE